ncbi:MAG: hypothetical protein ACMUIM_07470 [bacterium]
MWTLKKQMAFFLILTILLVILSSPAQVCCLTLSGTLIKSSGAKIKDVYIFVYEWSGVEQNGLLPAFPTGVTGNGITGEGYTGPLGEFSVSKALHFNGRNMEAVDIEAETEYLMIFSTRAIAQSETFPTFFLGSTNDSNPYPTSPPDMYRGLDPFQAPKIKFTGNHDFGNIQPQSGYYISGKVRTGSDARINGVRIELWIDQDGVPVQVPFPFYRFDITDETYDDFDFKLGGIQNGGKYYVKAVASDLGDTGYIDAFFKDSSGKPKLYTVTGQTTYPFSVGTLVLTAGGKISGVINDPEVDNNHAANSIIYIQAVSYKDQQVQFMQNYVHDPNYLIYSNESSGFFDWERYYFGYDHFHFDPDGNYELKGLPFEDHEYYLVATEFPSDTPKKFATPMFYDGVYKISDAQTITIPGAGATVTKNLTLKAGACIEGDVSFEMELGNSAKVTLDLTDPNVFLKLPLYIDAYNTGGDGDLVLLGQNWREGEGPFALCGLPPGDYIIRAYDASTRFYPGEYYDDQPTYITAERITLDFGDTSSDKDVVLALGGMLQGRVLTSGDAPVANMPVFINQVNAGNPLQGYYFINSEGSLLAQYASLTDSNGRFFITGLPEGLYNIFVSGMLEDGDSGFMPQFYDPNQDATMLANDASPIVVLDNDPNIKGLQDMHLEDSGTEEGGIISGNISLGTGIDPNQVPMSASAFFVRLFDADTGIEISNPLYRLFYDANNPSSTDVDYAIMVPSNANYHLAVHDTGGKLIPHYYNSPQVTVDPTQAAPLQISSTEPFISGIDFVLTEMGGEVSGHVLDLDGNAIAGIEVYARQEVLEGAGKDTWKSVVKATTDENGAFTIKPLYLGTYIFSAYDPYFRYASMYYPDTNSPEGATTWIYELNDPDPAPTIDFSLSKSSRITGSVTDASGVQIYAYLVLNGKPATGFSTIADPNFNLPGLISGKYILAYRDPNMDYLAIYYTQSGFTSDPNEVDPNDITIGSGTTFSVPSMSFPESARATSVQGQVNRKIGIDTYEPMANIYLFLYRMSDQKDIWSTSPEQFTATDENGNYMMKGLAKGDYKIIAFGPQDRPISKTLIDIEPGMDINGVDLTYPNQWLNKKYARTLKLEKGLNLIAYPTRLPPYVTGYTSMSFLKDIVMVNSRMSMTLKSYTPGDQTWRSTTFGRARMEGTQSSDVSGNNFYLANGKGFMLYSGKETQINFKYFPGQTSLWLSKGINLVGNVAFDPNHADMDDPNLAADRDFTTREMLSQMGEDASRSIRTYDAKAGKWQTNYWMWGKSAGVEIKVEDGKGYLVDMKDDLKDWRLTK